MIIASAWIHNCIDSRYDLGAFRLVFAFALILLFVENSLAACTQATSYFYSNRTNQMNGTCDPGSVIAPAHSCNNGDAVTYRYTCLNDGPPYMTDFKFDYCQSWGDYGYYTYYRCSSQCESKEYECNKKGWSWNSDECRCDDPTICGEYRSQCEEIGGIFHGVVTGSGASTCCRATCNVCGGESFKKLYDMKRKTCCDALLAPPSENQVCSTVDLPPNSCGMNWSRYAELGSNEWACRSPSLSPEASQSFVQNCSESSSSGDGGGSSSSGDGGGSSSSGDGGGSSSSGSPYPEGCAECPWLDSILDTLTAQKGLIGDLFFCIKNPSLCTTEQSGGSDSVIVEVDSIILDGVKERQDSVIRDIEKILKKMDSINITVDTAVFRDTALLRSINTGFDGLDSGLIRIKGRIVEMDTATRRRLDSLISRIPPDIFDSIVKYQDSSIDRFDSILWGKGVGFSLVDSLTDSIVKYFKVSNHYDSIYNAQFKSFDSTFKYKMDSLSFGIDGIDYSPLGYGDTASTTLRGDLEGVKSVIASLDSSVSGGIDNIVGLLAGTSVDTASADYGRGFVASGQRLGDSIKNAMGWGYVDTLNIDSMYARALSGYKSDSISQDVQDSLNELAVRMNDSLIAKTDSIKAVLPAVLDSMADSLVLWAPFADFDSIIYSSIGAHIPNRAECPEACQKWTVSIPIIGLHSYTVDFGLCLGRASFAGLSVLGFLKLLIRIIVAYTCIMTIGRVLVRMI